LPLRWDNWKYRGEPEAAQGLDANCLGPGADGAQKCLGQRAAIRQINAYLTQWAKPRLWARRSEMTLDARLEELSEKHRALDRKIEEELARPTADDLKVAEWKRQKLRLRDEIELLKHKMSH
jgi:hypothetical protein